MAKAAAAAAKVPAKGAPLPKAGVGKRGRDKGGDRWKPKIKRFRAK